MTPLSLRCATPQDIPALTSLIDVSVRILQQKDYSPEQVEGALGTVFGVDSQLIADGTYFVVEAALDGGKNKIVGCGGWSKRRTLFGSDNVPGRQDTLLDPKRDNAKIRALFIHPAWERKGVASRILAACESAASKAGFAGFELAATLTGERLFSRKGYEEIERIEVPLANRTSLPILRMSKSHSVS